MKEANPYSIINSQQDIFGHSLDIQPPTCALIATQTKIQGAFQGFGGTREHVYLFQGNKGYFGD